MSFKKCKHNFFPTCSFISIKTCPVNTKVSLASYYSLSCFVAAFLLKYLLNLIANILTANFMVASLTAVSLCLSNTLNNKWLILLYIAALIQNLFLYYSCNMIWVSSSILCLFSLINSHLWSKNMFFFLYSYSMISFLLFAV